jgi:hypothetical protein
LLRKTWPGAHCEGKNNNIGLASEHFRSPKLVSLDLTKNAAAACHCQACRAFRLRRHSPHPRPPPAAGHPHRSGFAHSWSSSTRWAFRMRLRTLQVSRCGTRHILAGHFSFSKCTTLKMATTATLTFNLTIALQRSGGNVQMAIEFMLQ